MTVESSYTPETGILVVSRAYIAEPDEVFAAWTQTDHFGKWWWRCVDCKFVRSEIEPKVGGSFNHYYVTDDKHKDVIKVLCKITEFSPSSRFAYEYAVPHCGDDGHTKVEVEFIDRVGVTCVKLTQSGLLAMALVRAIFGRTGIEIVPGNPLVIQKKWEEAFEDLANHIENTE